MNIDSHYYECENCPEKIDLALHEFDVTKENRYAFFVDDINIFDNFHMFKVGYVNTLTCKDCNIKIIDYKLIKNYYYNGVRQHQYYLEYLGVPTIEYNLMYGFTHFIPESAIEIKYDSNYNISSVYVDSRKENYPTYFNYTYIYEDDKLVKVELENNFVSTFGITYDLKYKDNKISEVTYTLVSGNDISKRVYLFDDNEKIISQVNYSIINSQSLKTLETIYQNGCLREKKTWTYNSSTGQLSSEANYQYENVFDSNNNILQHNNHDNTVSTTCTYNSNNQMLSMACSGGTTYSFEYENDKLVKMIYGNIVFDYQYDDNKVTVCDNYGKSFLEIEYISDYKIAE